jgi:hypothetical protein
MTIEHVILSSELAALGMDRELRTDFKHGRVHRIVPGAYVRTEYLTALDADARYRLQVAAVARLLPDTQFCRESAAALWRLPILGRWPAKAHASIDRAGGGRSGALVQRHALGLDPVATIVDGVRVTSLVRTLAEVATGPSFGRAVGMLDDALHEPEEKDFRHGLVLPTKAELLGCLDSLGRPAGFARASAAIEFADGLSGSLGESLSRVQMRAIGVPLPKLQVPFYDHLGLIGYVDYFWPEFGLVGEFDGHSKYGDARRFARHLSAQDVLIAEKMREDRLRAVVSGVVRWGWSTALDRYAFSELLGSRGLRGRRRGGYDSGRD